MAKSGQKSKAVPELDALKIFAELHEMQDRPAAIVAAALVEDAVEDCLMSRMAKLTKREHANLFHGNGPLSTFAAKTSLAHALKLLDRDWTRQIDVIRTVRNRFAHSRSSIDFMTPEIVELVNRLDVLERFNDHLDRGIIENTGHFQRNGFWQALKTVRTHVPRSRYLNSCMFFASWLLVFPPDPDDFFDDDDE